MSTAAFKVKQSTLNTGSQELRQYRNTLQSVQSSVGQARRVLNGMQGGISRVCVNLSKLENGIGRCAENTGSMAGVLRDVAGLYGKTEQTLTKSIGNNKEAWGNFNVNPTPIVVDWFGSETDGSSAVAAWIGKVGLEVGDDSLYAGVNAYLGKVEAKADADAGLMKTKTKREYKNGKWTEKEIMYFAVAEAEAGISGAILSGDAEVNIGDNMAGMELDAEGKVGSAEANIKGAFSIGEDGINANVKGKAMVAAVEGKASGTVNFMGIEIKGEVGGYAGAAGAEGKIGIEDGKFVMKGGVAAVIGFSGGIEIGFNEEGWENVEKGWNEFVDYITFWD